VKGELDEAGNVKDINGDGQTDLRDASTQAPTSLIDDAHKLGLFVHAFTFRNERRYLAHDYSEDPLAEYLQFFRLGVDGVFSEFPDTAMAARAALLIPDRLKGGKVARPPAAP
jgi:glycerophosphoryl diester phosphodiesterase